MLDALPRHVGDVQQAVDAAEVDERAVVGEVLDHALDDRAFLQLLEQLGALGAVFLLDDRATRHDDVVALLVELDDLELERPCLRGSDGSRTGRTSTSEPGRNARTKSISTVKPPLTRPLMMPLTISCFSNACSRRDQVRARLAFSRDRRVSPEPSSTLSSATSTSSPTLTSISPRSFLNCSTGMTASLFSPALTSTTSGPTVDDAAHEDRRLA